MIKYILAFFIVIAAIVAFSGPGIFINDEWVTAQQLRQLSQGHQVVYNEGGYGYYNNGTIGTYMSSRDNKLMYTLPLPLISLPAMIIISSLQTPEPHVSVEVLAICITNMIIAGLLSVVIVQICEHMFKNIHQQIFAWMGAMFASSILFWAGTLKDHVLCALIISLICLLLIKFAIKPSKYEFIIYVLAGLLLWVRIEIGVGVIIAIFLINWMINKKIISTIHAAFFMFIGSIPMFLNNYIATGDILIHPFLVANKGYSPSTYVATKTNYLFYYVNIDGIVGLFTTPKSGATGLCCMMALFILGIFFYIKYRPKISSEAKILISIGFGAIIFYIFYSGVYLGLDQGVLPDIRYFSTVYALFTIVGLSLIPYDFNYKALRTMTLLFTLAIGIIMILVISIEKLQYMEISIIPNLISTSFIILSALFIITLKDPCALKQKFKYIIPLLIASAFAWQLVMMFFYHGVKMSAYPIYLPLSDYVYNLIFT